MNNAPAGGHPLHITAGNNTLITQVILVTHGTIKHVGNGFKPAMGMGGKSTNIVSALLGMYFIEHQKWINLRHNIAARNATNLHAITI